MVAMPISSTISCVITYMNRFCLFPINLLRKIRLLSTSFGLSYDCATFNPLVIMHWFCKKRKLVTLFIHRSSDKLNFWWITSNVYEFQVVFHNLHWYNLYAFIVVVYHSLFDIISIKRLGNNMIAKKLKFSLYLWILFDDLMFQLKWMSIFTVTAFSAKF